MAAADPQTRRCSLIRADTSAKDAGKLYGLTYTVAYLDELQAFATGEVYVALARSRHRHPDAKLNIISTAGQSADSPLGRLCAGAR